MSTNVPTTPQMTVKALSRGIILKEIGVVFATGVILFAVLRPSPIKPGPGPFLTLGMVAAATWFLRGRGLGWAEFGLSRPKSWWKTVAWAIAGFLAMQISATIVSVLIAGKLGAPDLSAMDFIRGNFAMYLYMLLPIGWGAAAFGEEMLFRGFLLNRLAELFGKSRAAWVAASLLQAGVFGALHLYQGAGGSILTGTVALAAGAIYLAAGRNLWVTVLAHGLVDTLGLSALYMNVDRQNAS